MSEPKGIDAIWAHDRLGRQEDAHNIIRFAVTRSVWSAGVERKVSCVLNLDAGWGQGKTFLMERMGRQLTEMGYIVAQINAWQDDFADDPFVSVLAAINEAVEPVLSERGQKTKRRPVRKAWDAAKGNGKQVATALAVGMASQLLKRGTSLGVDEIRALIESKSEEDVKALAALADSLEHTAHTSISSLTDRYADTLLARHKEATESVLNFKKHLSGVVSSAQAVGIETPLFVLVDELDRCRPTYAISMLERIKHLFDIDGVVFVIATNTEQLSQSVRSVYGSDFGADEYLRRFFDRTYRFQPPVASEIVEQWVVDHEKELEHATVPRPNTFGDVLNSVVVGKAFSLRDLQQCLDTLQDILLSWHSRSHLQLPVMWPLIVGNHLGIEPVLRSEFGRHLAEKTGHLRGISVNSKRIRGENLFIEIAKLFESKKPWGDDVDRMGESIAPATSYALQVISDERHRRGNATTSLFYEYPKIAKLAGRFTQDQTHTP